MQGRELTKEELEIQTCSAHHNATSGAEAICSETIFISNSTSTIVEEDANAQEPKDYTLFLSCLTAFIAFFNIAMILFFNAPFKRSLANKSEPKEIS